MSITVLEKKTMT